MKAVVVENCYYAFNSYDYIKGETVIVAELEQFKDDYIIYHEDTEDWIPKSSVQLI